MPETGSQTAVEFPVPEKPNSVILSPIENRRNSGTTQNSTQNSLKTIGSKCNFFPDFDPAPEENKEVENNGVKRRPTAAVRPQIIEMPLFRSLEQYDPQKKKEKRRQQCLKVFKELGKHVGFLALLFAYTSLGGIIFWRLETDFDQKVRNEVEKELIFNLRNWCEIFQNSKPEICVEFLLNEIKNNATLMLPKELKPETMSWDFKHSMFFAITVYSTIGYGNIVPRTVAGKLVTMIYATIGIPLMLIVMTDLGGFLKSCVQLLWSKTKKYARAWFTNKVHSDTFSQIFQFEDYDFVPLPVWLSVLLLYLYIFFSAGVLMLFERDWDYMTGLWFSFVTFATIGFGDEFPKNPNYIYASFLFVVFGLSMVSMCLTTIKDYIRRRYAHAAVRQEVARKFIAKWKDMVERGKISDHGPI